ncbi:ribonuclease HI family protein [archaeon]|nr:ribonuclease HI family protein [archaeon]
MKIVLEFDGSCNSSTVGRTGIGVVLEQNGKIVKELSERTGNGTNNTAEYHALLRGLEAAIEIGAEELEARGDSELVIKQMKGEYKVKKEHLRAMYERAKELEARFKKVDYVWIPREKNELANALAQKAVFG